MTGDSRKPFGPRTAQRERSMGSGYPSASPSGQAAPAGLRAGHRVLVEAGAGAGSGLDDPSYRAAGAEMVSDKTALFERADLIVKVKEPLPAEYPLFRKSQALFTYLHLAANRPLTEALLDRRVFTIAYETVERRLAAR